MVATPVHDLAAVHSALISDERQCLDDASGLATGTGQFRGAGSCALATQEVC